LWFHLPVDSATEKRKRVDDESVEALTSLKEGSSVLEIDASISRTTENPWEKLAALNSSKMKVVPTGETSVLRVRRDRERSKPKETNRPYPKLMMNVGGRPSRSSPLGRRKEERSTKLTLAKNSKAKPKKAPEEVTPKNDNRQLSVSLVRMDSSSPLVIQTTQKPYRYFLPVNREWQARICKRFGLEIRRLLKLDPRVRRLTSPGVLQRTRGDGNCFFRSVSLYLVGSEEEHGFVRKEVVRYIREHPDEFESEIDDSYLEKMAVEGEWATDVEIRATARLLETPIFTWMRYNESDWQWQRFTPGVSLDDTLLDTAVPSLYIQNTSSCHYDVVKTVVKDDDGFSDS